MQLDPETRSTVWACGQSWTGRDGSCLDQRLETKGAFTDLNKHGNKNDICCCSTANNWHVKQTKYQVDKTSGTFSCCIFEVFTKELRKIHHLPNALLFFGKKSSNVAATSYHHSYYKQRYPALERAFNHSKYWFRWREMWKLNFETKLFSYSNGECVHVFVLLHVQQRTQMQEGHTRDQ